MTKPKPPKTPPVPGRIDTVIRTDATGRVIGQDKPIGGR